MKQESVKVVSSNRKAHHEYFIEDTLEAGIVLTGTEIKSIRAGHVSIQESFVAYASGELWIQGMHISAYDPGHGENHEPLRPRKLLMHDSEIIRWSERAQQRGYTIIPLRLYLKHGRAKVEIGLGKGKKLYDKRQSIAQKDARRNVERAIGDHQRGRR